MKERRQSFTSTAISLFLGAIVGAPIAVHSHATGFSSAGAICLFPIVLLPLKNPPILAKELDQKWATRVNLIIHNHPLDTDPSGFKKSKNTGDRKSANYVKHAIFYVYKPGKGVLMQYDAKQLYVEEKKWETVFPYK